MESAGVTLKPLNFTCRRTRPGSCRTYRKQGLVIYFPGPPSSAHTSVLRLLDFSLLILLPLSPNFCSRPCISSTKSTTTSKPLSSLYKAMLISVAVTHGLTSLLGCGTNTRTQNARMLLVSMCWIALWIQGRGLSERSGYWGVNKRRQAGS